MKPAVCATSADGARSPMLALIHENAKPNPMVSATAPIAASSPFWNRNPISSPTTIISVTVKV